MCKPREGVRVPFPSLFALTHMIVVGAPATQNHPIRHPHSPTL